MNKHRLAQHSPDITAEACAWIAQLETGDLTPADLHAFREWMQRSPRHAVEIRELADLSENLNALSELSDSLQKAAHAYHPITAGNALGHGFWVPQLASIGAAAAVILTAIFFLYGASDNTEPHQVLATQVGQIQEFRLSDGTTVQLNTNSRIRVEYGQQERRVQLLAGEVFFQVAHNQDKPFVVMAGGKSVRAVGTAFVVRLDLREFEVTVTEGRVELAGVSGHPDQPSSRGNSPFSSQVSHGRDFVPKSVLLKAGQTVVISAATQVLDLEEVSPGERRRRLSWQAGMYDFSDTPLSEVVREINRHNSVQIRITDPALQSLKFGGNFRTDNTDLLLEALESAFAVEVRRVDESTVHISSSKRG